ncbi:MAG: GWxTD domain-containing protein [Acidobacteriota bacterium]
MRNFSISCARTEPRGRGASEHRAIVWVVAVLLAAWCVTPAAALKKKGADAEELFNPLLGVEYSHWLVGPIYHMTTDKEIAEYQALTSDEEAEQFIRAFWERHNEGTELFKKTPEQIFEQRAETADSRYSEGTLPGRLTDRGTVFILFGEPEETEFESSELLEGPPIENWVYGKKAAPGIHGQKPKKEYRFVEIDGATRFFNNKLSELEARKRQRKRIRF